MAKTTESILEIDLDALKHNYNYLSSKLKNETKLLAVVKAYGYGSDSCVIAAELVNLGIDYLGVAHTTEGEILRNAQIEVPVLVLHPLPAHFSLLIGSCLEPSIYSEKMLKEFIDFAEQNGQSQYPIHLKFNTGLNRLGFKKEDISSIISKLKKTNSVKVVSVFSHLAASEDLNETDFSMAQIKSFEAISSELIDQLGYKPLLHMVNTSGILNYPEAHFDMVRTGIGLYGFGNDPNETENLRPVSTLKTVISQIHILKAGETIGYNMGFRADKDVISATLPIGHADGISRSYGHGKGWVTIHGEKAPILGNVCMDMIMVDVTSIACDEGDEVVVFGDHPNAEELSAAINTIPYELLTAISQRIKRVVRRSD